MTPADPAIEYAYWTEPGERSTITYALPVFHDIDFQVSEGFRRIPHGGVETGGLLFGRIDQSSARLGVQIEAFRPIECEHASGPSFNLSERDVAALAEQLAAAKTDPELQGLQVVGWFVAHTRSPLEINERERLLFSQFFPGPGRILMLVKPERFQPTRFAFFIRGADGRMNSDAAATAIILPLPGRAARSVAGPAASIPAPAPPPAASPKAPAPPAQKPIERPAAPPSPPPPPPMPAALPLPAAPKVSARMPDAGSPADTGMSTRAFWRNYVPTPGARPQPVVSIINDGATTLPPSPEKAAASSAQEASSGQQRITRPMRRGGMPSVPRLVALLLLAAGLGCGVGYIAYLQLPAATIALTVQRAPAGGLSGGRSLVVSWPPEETRDAMFASIRVDDGEAVPLSTEQKEEGRAEVPLRSDNVKIEVIAQRRWRGSRGIVRYVRARSVTP